MAIKLSNDELKMTANRLVSIIIPTYNYGHYLAGAIESALRQTHQNIEIIVVDDGSTDNTRHVAKLYPVIYSFQKNQGVATAINNGIKLSHGEFFVCLGADDKLAPKYVDKTLEAIITKPNIGFVCVGSNLWDEDLEVGNLLLPRKIYNKFEILALGWVGALGTVLTRRIAFDSLADGFDASLPAHEDADFCFRLLCKGWKSVIVCEVLHWYRLHKGSRNAEIAPYERFASDFLNRKFPRKRAYDRLHNYYVNQISRIIQLMRHPIQYLIGIKTKTKVKVMVKSRNWIASQNREKANKIYREIWETIDNLLDWFRNEDLRYYYTRRIKILESRLQSIFSIDATHAHFVD